WPRPTVSQRRQCIQWQAFCHREKRPQTRLLSYVHMRVRSSCPVVMSHSFAVRSKLPVTNLLPSGEKATEVAGRVCPLRESSSCPVATSHSFTVAEPLFMAIALPSGEKAIGNNRELKISLRVSGSCPAVTSHNLAVPSPLPVASLLPSGEKATEVTAFPCPLR